MKKCTCKKYKSRSKKSRSKKNYRRRHQRGNGLLKNQFNGAKKIVKKTGLLDKNVDLRNEMKQNIITSISELK